MPERGWKTSTVPVIWATFGIFRLCAIQIISCRDCWPWSNHGYITMFRREGKNQWSGGIAPRPPPSRPKNFGVQKSAGKVLASFFFGIKSASSSLIIFHSAKLSTRSITHVCWCNWRTFWRKNAALREGDQMCLFLHGNAPADRALASQKELAYLGFHCLVHQPYYPDLTPSDYHLFPGLKKKLKDDIFRPTWWSLLPRRPGWKDNIVIFFLSSLRKLEQWAKKCIELRGEYVE